MGTTRTWWARMWVAWGCGSDAASIEGRDLRASQMLTPAWSIEGNQDEASFGMSVAGGDLNVDGFADLVVGAPDFDDAFFDEGSASLYFGSAVGLNTAAAWTVTSDQEDAELGYSVAVGDVNGDGFGDVIVGSISWEDDVATPGEGQVSVFHGTAGTPDTVPAWTAQVDESGDFFGFAVASAGDVNADGFDDVIVGTPFFDASSADGGGAWMYLGSATGAEAEASWHKESDQAGSQHGFSIASAGDVNGDGFDDVVVGAPYYESSDATAEEGRALLFLGSASGLEELPVWTAEGELGGATFAWSVASAGDVNGDGFDDIVVGAPYYTDTLYAEGAAFVYFGSAAGPDTVAGWSVVSQQYATLFGFSVDSAGDMNDDGFDDVAVGAPYYADVPIAEGTAFVFYGSAAGPSTIQDLTAESDQVEPFFGFAVTSIGDVNGDAYDELVVGAPWWDGGETDEGAAFVYRGSCSKAVDTDGDTIGDLCDLCPGFDDLVDDDADGIPEDCDVCPGVADAGQEDDDADGIGDACDACPLDATDADSDGWCEAEDCDDADPNAFPGAPELCDGIDNACAGSVPPDESDEDADGTMMCAGDCNDLAADVHPGAVEACNGIDDDCAGGPTADEVDADGDGALVCAGDCDDADEQRSPAFDDPCGDSVDNNCDGAVDETCAPPADIDDGGCGCAGVRGGSPAAWLALLLVWAAGRVRSRR